MTEEEAPDWTAIDLSKVVPKLSDFGQSRGFNLSRQTMTMSLQGTIEYMAPELLKALMNSEKTTRYNSKADIFSLGKLAYVMHTRGSPKAGKQNIGFYTGTLQKRYIVNCQNLVKLSQRLATRTFWTFFASISSRRLSRGAPQQSCSIMPSCSPPLGAAGYCRSFPHPMTT